MCNQSKQNPDKQEKKTVIPDKQPQKPGQQILND